MRSIKNISAALFLAVCIPLIAGCGMGQLAVNTATDKGENESNDSYPADTYQDSLSQEARGDLLPFSQFMEEIFVDEVTSDLISLNYSVANPKNYGIETYRKDYGDLSLDNLGDDSQVVSLLSTLNRYDYDALTADEQLTYDILKDYLETELEYSDLYLYNKTLSPTIGLTCQLPVVLAEFSFRSEQDVYDYLELLGSTQEYLDYILTLEQMKSQAGLFMMDEVADEVIAQAESFISDADDNYLIGVFDEKIDAMDCFTDTQKASLKEQNAALIKENVIEAYKTLAEGLGKLKGTCKYEGGLCNYPEGDRYYEYLVKSGTGSKRSIDEIESLIDKYMVSAYFDMSDVLSENPDIYDMLDDVSFGLTDPYEILEDLSVRIQDEFPALPDTTYTIKYVPQALGEYLSPAFYMVPAIDDYLDNSIYINEYCNDASDIYTTLAHEGLPGHLYQSVYSNTKITSPVRSIIDYAGYTEGWATYVELLSYKMGAIDADLGELLSANQLVILGVYAKCDIGVNYHNWQKSDVKTYITALFGDLGDDVIDEIYIAMVSEPANYLKYVVGCLEFMELRSSAQEGMGDAFDAVSFHDFILSIGAAPFDIIENRMEIWLEEQKDAISR